MNIIRSIQSRVYELRGQRVMLDFDLAALYKVEPSVLMLTVTLNKEQFPENIAFQLKPYEYELIQPQIDAIKKGSSLQIETMRTIAKNLTDQNLPFAFTRHGVAILSLILKSGKVQKSNSAIKEAIENLRNEKGFQRKWNRRKQIGFKAGRLNKI